MDFIQREMDYIQRYIESLFEENQIEYLVFGKVYCKYCTKAKHLLTSKDIKFLYLDLDEIDISGKLLKKLKVYTKMDTIPIIFNNSKLIGGYTDLERILTCN